MRLGTETGSVINHLQARMVKNAPEPVEGMGVTFLHWTDRSPGTVVAWDGETLVVTEDTYKRLDKGGPYTEHQEYEYTTQPNGNPYFFKRLPDGRWQEKKWNATTKRWNKGGQNIFVGRREKYLDPCF